MFAVMSMVIAFVMVADGKTGAGLMVPALMALGGGGVLVANAIRLPRWAGERERQMDHIAAWTNHLLSAAPKGAEEA